jgi:hypothetical protein
MTSSSRDAGVDDDRIRLGESRQRPVFLDKYGAIHDLQACPVSRYSAFWDSQGSVYAFSPVHLSLSDDQDTGLKQKKPADSNRAEVPHARNLIDRKELFAFFANGLGGNGGGSSVHDSFPSKEVKSILIEFCADCRNPPKAESASWCARSE